MFNKKRLKRGKHKINFILIINKIDIVFPITALLSFVAYWLK